jgi:hypothetical protein
LTSAFGLVMADAEFCTDTEEQSFLPPPAAVAEVTDDPGLAGPVAVLAEQGQGLLIATGGLLIAGPELFGQPRSVSAVASAAVPPRCWAAWRAVLWMVTDSQ